VRVPVLDGVHLVGRRALGVDELLCADVHTRSMR
jgi:hypothetical protein